ncbi:hypothetical protein [Jeotgalibacillus terrae]|uniref:Uncharacterized protein n=1 Tax=Jeotgalibacillus terrae TaxID=587735 RepID=A0ABW5ZNM3_9BACL|nr:hypothetical protein [Jeotgalibacillus terrae]MBM7578221.1 hypothetical protein [Jeotgalibacillus terrae]
MKKKVVFLVLSFILMFSSLGLSEKANANSADNLNLTPEQEQQVNEMVKEWDRFNQLTDHLTEVEIERLFRTADVTRTKSNAISMAASYAAPSSEIVIAQNKNDVKVLNEQLEFAQQQELPEGTVSVKLKDEHTFLAVTDSGEEVILPAGFWGGAWQVTKCVAHLTLVLIPGGAAFKAVRALGGIKTTAQLLVGAGNAKDFLLIAGGSASAILGIDGIYKNCLQW